MQFSVSSFDRMKQMSDVLAVSSFTIFSSITSGDLARAGSA